MRVPSAVAYFRPYWVERFITFACVPSTNVYFRPISYDEFHAKIKIELIVEDTMVEQAIESITNAAYSGKIGDGKIFISSIEQVIRIRTGEKDSDAV